MYPISHQSKPRKTINIMVESRAAISEYMAQEGLTIGQATACLMALGLSVDTFLYVHAEARTRRRFPIIRLTSVAVTSTPNFMELLDRAQMARRMIGKVVDHACFSLQNPDFKQEHCPFGLKALLPPDLFMAEGHIPQDATAPAPVKKVQVSTRVRKKLRKLAEVWGMDELAVVSMLISTHPALVLPALHPAQIAAGMRAAATEDNTPLPLDIEPLIIEEGGQG